MTEGHASLEPDERELGDPATGGDGDDAPGEPDAQPEADAPRPERTNADGPGDALTWARRYERWWIGGGLALVYVIWLLVTARSLGFSRDEGFYFTAGYDYQRWFELLFKAPRVALERSAIDRAWATNHEHPSLMKGLFALSHLFLFGKLKIFSDESTAFRFPGMLMMGLAIFLTYSFAARAFSRRAGIVAAVLLGLMPRVFYHAHLACFDVPIMAMWLACVYVYWRAEGGDPEAPPRDRLTWALFAGIVYGLTLETKHNAWMLPAVFLPHALVVHGRALSRQAARTGRLPIPATLVAMATIGPAVFVLLWPWMWNDTLPRLTEYVNFHVHHEYYNIEFLGKTYFGPPSPASYMPVMIFATVPTVTLVLGVIGIGARGGHLVAAAAAGIAPVRERIVRSRFAGALAAVERPRAATDLLLLLAMAVPLSVFLLPRTPIFGGTKHWIPAYPFIAIFAGHAFDCASRRLEAIVRAKWSDAKPGVIALGAGVLAASGPLAVTIHSHPFGLSSYVPFVGGTAGGADLGLNRQFWGFTTESLADYFAKNAKPGARVYIMDTSWPSWARMIDEKRLPPTLRGVGSPSEADFAIVHHEQHINEVDYNIWTDYGTASPDYVLTHDGVPIISVYRRR